MGMCAKTRAGEWCGGIPPLGYKWVPMEGTENLVRKKSRLEIDDVEADTVRLIYKLYVSGKVRFNVRRDWNEKHRHNINPEPIIVDGIHDATISDKFWQQVQLIMGQKSGKPSRLYGGEYPLTVKYYVVQSAEQVWLYPELQIR